MKTYNLIFTLPYHITKTKKRVYSIFANAYDENQAQSLIVDKLIKWGLITEERFKVLELLQDSLHYIITLPILIEDLDTIEIKNLN